MSKAKTTEWVSRSRSWSHDRLALVDAVIPFYHSIDFEVHRHWLALTHSFPLSQWYSDETSPWTLDYPPFFAYFERVLSIFANPTMVLFQRITVILSDLCLLYGVYRLTKDLDSRRRISIWVLIIWSLMLVIVDHMHFQYNEFLLGLLLMSLSYLEEGRDLMGEFVFAVLLCFKHLFAVVGLVYFVELLPVVLKRWRQRINKFIEK